MTGLWRTDHCDNRLTNRHSETSHRTPKTPRKRTTCHVLSPRASSLCVHVSSEVGRSCTIREGTTQDRARHSTRAPFAAHHNEHGDVEASDEGTQSNARRHSTTQKTVRRRKGTSSPEDQDSQFRCAHMARRPNSLTPCLFQAIVKCSCLGILWQSRFADELPVSRSVSSAEHDNRQR